MYCRQVKSKEEIGNGEGLLKLEDRVAAYRRVVKPTSSANNLQACTDPKDVRQIATDYPFSANRITRMKFAGSLFREFITLYPWRSQIQTTFSSKVTVGTCNGHWKR